MKKTTLFKTKSIFLLSVLCLSSVMAGTPQEMNVRQSIDNSGMNKIAAHQAQVLPATGAGIFAFLGLKLALADR